MFSTLKKAVSKKFFSMQKHPLFRVEVDKTLLWETYLSSFPSGTDPMYKNRTEHDCQCCKQFIRAVGNVVAIIDGKIVSIWDLEVDNFYQEVANGMSSLIHSCALENVFLHSEPTAGTDKNYGKRKDGSMETYTHFFLELPKTSIVNKNDIGTRLGTLRSSKDVFLRALQELTMDSIDTVLELISQNSLYRGEEHTATVRNFRKVKVEFDKLATPQKEIFVWSILLGTPAPILFIRNSVIGSLLVDLSEGKDLEYAVKSFEAKVAPTNYKRPTTLVTKGMIEKAKATIVELGLEPSLDRRYANLEDITVNNILFANRDAKRAMGEDVFSEMSTKVPENLKNFDKVEEINIEKFLQEVLPKANSLEVLLENRHAENLVSLVAPVYKDAKPLFKWPNNFSWSYKGELADSMKERVKSAGGKVDGDLRCSLSWFNYDDLDLHMIEPGNSYKIYFANKSSPSPSGGKLDVDMNAGVGKSRNAVENICYPDRNLMKEGIYTLKVNNFAKRENVDLGFDIEIEFDGTLHYISYPKQVANGSTVEVAQIKWSKKDGFSVVSSLPSTQTVKTMWGVSTQAFYPVSVAMMSPNHWDNHPVGNKHYFFMLEGCKNEDKARGFFNEFLSEELNPHRKVLEIVGTKMKTDNSDKQLSGLGFSSTQRSSVLCRVKGSFSRVVKVTF
jgi:hypothetical protein